MFRIKDKHTKQGNLDCVSDENFELACCLLMSIFKAQIYEFNMRTIYSHIKSLVLTCEFSFYNLKV